MARFNFIRKVKQDFRDAENNYVFFCNANIPLMNNIRFENDIVIAKAKHGNANKAFQRAVRIGIGKGVFNFATVEKMERLLKLLNQELIDVQNWNAAAVNASNKIREQLCGDISRTW